MIKIAIFTDNLKVGGVQKSIINFLNNIDLKKYEIDLYLFDNDIFYEESLPKNVNVIFLNKTIKFTKFLPFNLVYKILKSKRITTNYDYAIDFDSYQFDTAFHCLKCKSTHKIIWIHNNVIEEHKYLLKYRILHFFMKSKYKFFDKFVGVSEGVIKPFQELNKIYDKEFYVVPNFVDSGEIIKKSKEKVDITIDDSKYNLISVGRVCYQKGFDILLSHLKELSYYQKDFHFYLIGDGDRLSELKKYVIDNKLEDYVTFLGAKSNPYKYMKKMDGFILTSRFEGQGIVILEAKCLGLDIFISKNIEKYNGYNIKGTDNIVESLKKIKKHKKRDYDCLIDYNKNIKKNIEKLLCK